MMKGSLDFFRGTSWEGKDRWPRRSNQAGRVPRWRQAEGGAPWSISCNAPSRSRSPRWPSVGPAWRLDLRDRLRRPPDATHLQEHTNGFSDTARWQTPPDGICPGIGDLDFLRFIGHGP